MDLTEILAGLGLNLAASAIAEAIKAYLASTVTPTPAGLHAAIEPTLKANNLRISAASVFEALAAKGVIEIRDGSIHAGERITFGSGANGRAVFEGTGTMEAGGSKIAARNARMEARGGASVVVTKDSVKFVIK